MLGTESVTDEGGDDGNHRKEDAGFSDTEILDGADPKGEGHGRAQDRKAQDRLKDLPRHVDIILEMPHALGQEKRHEICRADEELVHDDNLRLVVSGQGLGA